MMLSISWEMGSSVINALHEGVDRITVSLYTGDNNLAILVLKCFGLLDTCGTTTYCFVVDSSCVIDCKSYIFDAISMLRVVLWELRMIRIQRRLECEGKFIIAHNVRAEFSLSSFESLSEIRLYQIRIKIHLPCMQHIRIPCGQCKRQQLIWHCQPRIWCDRSRGIIRFQATAKQWALKQVYVLTLSVGFS